MPKLQKLKDGSYIISVPIRLVKEMGWEKGEQIETDRGVYAKESEDGHFDIIMMYALKRHERNEVKNDNHS